MTDNHITAQRQKHYGDPLANFAQIDALFTALCEARCERLTEPHAVHLASLETRAFKEFLHMLAVKISRLCFDPTHADSLQDIAGYAKAAHSFLCPDEEWKEV